MLRFFIHQVSNSFANMGQIRIYNYLTNQLINQLTISVFFAPFCGHIKNRYRT